MRLGLRWFPRGGPSPCTNEGGQIAVCFLTDPRRYVESHPRDRRRRVGAPKARLGRAESLCDLVSDLALGPVRVAGADECREPVASELPRLVGKAQALARSSPRHSTPAGVHPRDLMLAAIARATAAPRSANWRQSPV